MISKTPLNFLVEKLDGAGRLSRREREAIVSLPVKIREFSADRDITHERAYSHCCCIILSGWICCYQMLDGGRRSILALHVPGDVPDLQRLHLPDPDFGMAALTPVVAAFVPHAELRGLADSFPAIATALWREALITAAIHRAWIAGLTRRDARGRLAHLFCELHTRLKAVGLVDGYTMPMPLRQSDLADALGLTSVHVNRTLRDLRAEGLIRLRARRLEILDWPGLQAKGEFNPRYLHLAA